ncbi:MAG: hypothetical protein CVU44_17325 [Chloroflexi bacterium HGW-Chloroflexi-6]|nr:MAG: hypothetical protein CVU44_17325 [Chloroflexi bacterium HGW-Chloroflexi-6]
MNNAVSGYLDKFGSNFLIAAMIPSLGLVIAILTIFEPILQPSALINAPNSIYQGLGVGVLVLVPTVIVGFTLTALNTYILKFFEGYVFFRYLPILVYRQREKAKKLIGRKETLRKRISVLESWSSNPTPRTKKILRRLRNQYYNIAANYDKNFPPEIDDVLPTEFGNILKASEAYSSNRYGMDGVEFWPRLRQVIPDRYQDSIDSARNQLSFLVNMSVLALFFSFLCSLPVLFILGFFSLSPVSTLTYIDVFAYSYRYLIAGLLGLFCFAFFQKASIYSVGSFGIMIRSAYDLFRLDLLKHFHIKMPDNSVQEFHIWRNIGELLTLGQQSLTFQGLEYLWDDAKQPSLEKKQVG